METIKQYTGDEATRSYLSPQTFLDKSYIYASVSGLLITQSDTLTDTTFIVEEQSGSYYATFGASILLQGGNIIILRKTPSDPLVVFSNSSTIQARDLNVSFTQAVHIAVEVDDQVEYNRDNLPPIYVDDVLDLPNELAGKSDVGHTHPISEVDNLQNELDKAIQRDISGVVQTDEEFAGKLLATGNDRSDPDEVITIKDFEDLSNEGNEGKELSTKLTTRSFGQDFSGVVGSGGNIDVDFDLNNLLKSLGSGQAGNMMVTGIATIILVSNSGIYLGNLSYQLYGVKRSGAWTSLGANLNLAAAPTDRSTVTVSTPSSGVLRFNIQIDYPDTASGIVSLTTTYGDSI